MTEAPDEYADQPAGEESPAEEASIEGLAGEGLTAEEPLRTGDPRVDEVLSTVDGLHELPVGEHAAVFEAAHDELRAALEPDRESA